MASVDYATILSSFHQQQTTQPLSILTLADPLHPPNPDHSTNKTRESDPSSASEQDSPTPHSLALDLSHYRDLFSKLRFSYLEQVTKEKYLKSIVGDPPVLVTHAENAELETRLAVMKEALKAKKVETDEMVKEMELLAQELAERYEVVRVGMGRLETLPAEVAKLQRQVEELRRMLAEQRDGLEGSEDSRMNMGMKETREALEEQERRNEELDEEIQRLQMQLPGKIRECEKVERDLVDLGGRRDSSTKAAREVRRLREEGGRDLLEEQGRWLRSEEIVLKGLLGVEAN